MRLRLLRCTRRQRPLSSASSWLAVRFSCKERSQRSSKTGMVDKPRIGVGAMAQDDDTRRVAVAREALIIAPSFSGRSWRRRCSGCWSGR